MIYNYILLSLSNIFEDDCGITQNIIYLSVMQYRILGELSIIITDDIDMYFIDTIEQTNIKYL